ncbi:MAG: hypothetical protein JWN03_4318 [Nocardia sp.]|uniref:MazG nucleotide pyrophosphohydrolase domain-containing protein n=1 Tax=Nocardia sp. TaxID=1821 RepID=UPI00261815AC|nr:MazG nucleotide pyrophosphohydrolase domain-containing protein [Nocardia sp.]MCU1644043.1 hypothetical protein [Nocardia sp.]
MTAAAQPQRHRVIVQWLPVPSPTDETDIAVLGLDGGTRVPVGTLFGLDIVVETTPDPTPTGPAVTVRHTADDDFVVTVRAATWDSACALATAPVFAVLAWMSGRLYLQGSLLHTTHHGDAVLLLEDPDPAAWRMGPSAVSGPHVLVDARQVPATAVALAPDALWQSPITTSAICPVGAVAVVNGDARRFMPAKMLRPYLAGCLGVSDRRWARMIRGTGAGPLLATIDSVQRTHIDALMSGAAAVSADLDQLQEWVGHGDVQMLIGTPPIRYSAAALAGVRAMQDTALQVYGRYRPEGAFVWTVEELGELAAAIRRGESPARLSEELGQLFNWLLCLANIEGVDLAVSSSHALEREGRRQMASHGRLRPSRALEVVAGSRA